MSKSASKEVRGGNMHVPSFSFNDVVQKQYSPFVGTICFIVYDGVSNFYELVDYTGATCTLKEEDIVRTPKTTHDSVPVENVRDTPVRRGLLHKFRVGNQVQQLVYVDAACDPPIVMRHKVTVSSIRFTRDAATYTVVRNATGEVYTGVLESALEELDNE